ncbi:MAG: DUF4976 domain-containing protein, partial [Lentisphaerae bacterium]
MKQKRPHVLILMCDQMQHHRLGILDPNAYTPHLDRLVSEGVHFTHAFTQQGQCVPARAVFMTGQPAHRCGVIVNYGFYGHQNMLTSRHVTLPSILRRHGYHTVHFGKRHFGTHLDALGFDVWDDYEEHEPDDEEAADLGIQFVPNQLRKDYRAAQQAVEFLNNYSPQPDRPLYFVFSTNLPHPPFFTDPNYRDRFSPEQFRLPESFFHEDFAHKPPFLKEHVEDGRHGIFDPDALREMMHQYYTMIAAMDEHIGQMIECFKAKGMWEDTLVLFFADHGDMMGSHKMRLKGTLPYDELYRIPCIFKLPQSCQAISPRVSNLVSSVQFPATILDLCGIEPPPSFEGESFARLFFEHVPTTSDKPVFFEHYAAYWGIHPFCGIRTHTHKYVYYLASEEEELYDLEQDPNELHNLASVASLSGLKKQLKDQLLDWWQKTGGKDVAYYESD